jgi:molybdate transport system substrate-binding protein
VKTLHLLCAGAAKGLVQGLQRDFVAAHQATVEADFGAVGAMREKLLAGVPCDLIILSEKVIDELAGQKRVDAASRMALGRVDTGIAVPAFENGIDAKPDIADADALRRALSNARGIYLPDPERATAGIHFAKVLAMLGILDQVRSRLRPYPNGATAMRAMADAGEPDLIGCTQVSEILYTSGVALVGVLPKEFALSTTYSAAVCRDAKEPALARAFALLLTGPASVDMRRAGGFAT